MPITLPTDFDLTQGLAILFLYAAWFLYATVLKAIAQGSLNEQLSSVRARWLMRSVSRAQKPFDAILIGNIVNSIAFFGSATMIVLAGVVTLLVNVRSVHDTVSALTVTQGASFELFVIHVTVLMAILTLAFFSFTYALRKLIYVLALIGALPEGPLDPDEDARREAMVASTAVVLSEALKTFNFGIRGYYYAVASLGLFVSPYLCLALTVVATAVLMHRQVGTRTAHAIQAYVDASKR